MTEPAGEHGVAISSVDAIGGRRVLVMCQCGWHKFLAEVTTFDYVAELVSAHRLAATTPGVRPLLGDVLSSGGRLTPGELGRGRRDG